MLHCQQLIDCNIVVNVAVARPEYYFFVLDKPLHVQSKVRVRNKYYRVDIQTSHHINCVRRGAAYIGFSLHFRSGVDIGNNSSAWMFILEVAKALGISHGGHGASGVRVGYQNLLFRIQYCSGLGHEVHAAEYYHVCISLHGLPRELEGVAKHVCYVLHLWPLVVVRQDNRVLLVPEPGDSILKPRHRPVNGASV